MLCQRQAPPTLAELSLMLLTERQMLALKLEGIVGKRAGSTYQAGVRSPDWEKIKRPGAVPAQRFWFYRKPQ